MGLHEISGYIKQGTEKRHVKVAFGSPSTDFKNGKFYLRAKDKSEGTGELQAIIGGALHVSPRNVKISFEGTGSANIYVSYH